MRNIWRYLLAAAGTILVNGAVIMIITPQQVRYRPPLTETVDLNIIDMDIENVPEAVREQRTAPPMKDTSVSLPLPALEPVPLIDSASPHRLPAAMEIDDVALALDFSVPPAAPASSSILPAAAGGISHGPMLIEPPDLSAYYPHNARQRGVTGMTTIRVTVSRDGKVTASEVLDSSPPGVFDDAARRLGLSLTFRPARINGQTASVRTRIKFHWRIDASAAASMP